MSQGSLAGQAAIPDAPVQHRICEEPTERWDVAWQWVGERVNPIVVKEIRQSLKSRQFTISFGLTLIAAVGWTLIAISLMVPRVYYLPGGLPLLTGFFCILTLPLMVIIPFSAFRSLTSETEDGTFELLSISALSSTQIIYGKMASACVQIMLYLSALAPCIVLTYLLRGVGLFAILLMLGITVLFSIAETAAALTLAAVARSRMIQNGVSVLVLGGLLLGFFAWTMSIIGILGEANEELANPPKEIYLILFGVLTVVVPAISLLLRAAAAAIDFPSENSSTPLRIRIAGLIGLILFWLCMITIVAEDTAPVLVFSVGLFIVMMFIGGLVTGERGVISPRTQRTLPKSFLGRVFLTWLYPGAGLGYVFLVCLFAGWAGTLSGLEIYYEASFRSPFNSYGATTCNIALTCYLVIYLGINRLILLALPSHLQARMLVSVAMLAVFLLMAHLLPILAVYYANDYREPTYGIHQTFNIFWTTYEIADGRGVAMGEVLTLLTLCAVGVFGLNLLLCTRDVMLVRVAAPPRVAKEKTPRKVAPAEPIDPFA